MLQSTCPDSLCDEAQTSMPPFGPGFQNALRRYEDQDTTFQLVLTYYHVQLTCFSQKSIRETVTLFTIVNYKIESDWRNFYPPAILRRSAAECHLHDQQRSYRIF